MVTTGKWRRKSGSLKRYEDPRIIFYGFDETNDIVKELKEIGINLSEFMRDAVKNHYRYCMVDNPGMIDIYRPDTVEIEDLEQTKLF